MRGSVAAEYSKVVADGLCNIYIYILYYIISTLYFNIKKDKKKEKKKSREITHRCYILYYICNNIMYSVVLLQGSVS